MIGATEKAIGGIVIRRLGAHWFAGVLLFSFFIIYALLPEAAPAPQAADLDGVSIVITMFSLLLVTVIAATEIPYDISGRVLLVVLSKPIRRHQYVIGKVLGIAAAAVIYVAVCFLFAAGCLYFFRGYTPGMETVNAGAAVALRCVAFSGFAVFLSVASSEVPTIAGCIAAAIVSFLLNLLALMLFTSGLEPACQKAIDPLLYCLPGLLSLTPPPTMLGDWLTGYERASLDGQSFGMDDLLAMKVDNLGGAALYTLIYLLLFLALSVWTFRRSEKVE